LRNSSADLQVKNPPPCSYQSQHNPDCYKTKQELESAIDLLNNRPFKQETIKIPEQNLNGVEVQVKNPPPCSYQSQHNPDCCC
jgi:hypothetical protein